MSLDISDTLAAKSDQLNAADLAQPLTTQIVRASRGEPDQPLNLHLSDWPHPWRPCKSMRRLLSQLWGTDAAQWVGRAVRLYCDPTAEWAGKPVGGIRVSGASHIDRPVDVRLPVRRGQYVVYRVEPLPAPTSTPTSTPTLEDVLERLGLTVERIDAYRAANGKPSIAGLTDAQRAALAGWLTPDRAEAILAATEADNG